MGDSVNHPHHYGGENNPLEVIKIIEYYMLDFNLGNTVKYLLRAGKKITHGDANTARIEDLQKAAWYLNREIQNAIAGKTQQTAETDSGVKSPGTYDC